MQSTIWCTEVHSAGCFQYAAACGVRLLVMAGSLHACVRVSDKTRLSILEGLAVWAQHVYVPKLPTPTLHSLWQLAALSRLQSHLGVQLWSSDRSAEWRQCCLQGHQHAIVR